MTTLFVLALSAGLLLAVYAMLHGVERGGASYGQLDAPPSRMVLSLPAAAAALSAFGAGGYVLARWGGIEEARTLALALLAALVIAGVVVVLVRRWARSPATVDGDDPRFFLMGHLAHVTEAIARDGEGRIAYQVNGASHASRARSTDGSPLPANSEVVIEKIEDDVAYVESWSEVERRL